MGHLSCVHCYRNMLQFPIFGEIRPGNSGGVKTVNLHIHRNSHDYDLFGSNFPMFAAYHKPEARNISALIPNSDNHPP